MRFDWAGISYPIAPIIRFSVSSSPPSPDTTASEHVSVVTRPIVNVPSPPSQQAAQKTIQVSTTINLDGRKIAEAVTKHQVEEGAGPPEGAPYHDSTYSTIPPDFALAL